MAKIPTLWQIYQKLDCQEKTKDGVCWIQCNTRSSKAVAIFHGVTGGKIDMMPLAERYIGLGYAVYAFDLPGHGGSKMLSFRSYDDMADWMTRALDCLGRPINVLISNSFSSSIVYHLMRKELLPESMKIIMGCPTPDPSRLADVLQSLSNHLPHKLGWSTYNSKPAQKIRVAVLLQTKREDAWQWLSESERYKKETLTLDDSNVLTTLLYRQNPYQGVISDVYDVSIVMGGKDNVVTSRTLEIVHQLMPHAQLIIAPEAGHILHFEAVDQYPEV